MSPEMRCKAKAFLIIAMLVVAEGSRIEKQARFGAAANGPAASPESSHDFEAIHKAANDALGFATHGLLGSDMLFNDPIFSKQLEEMAGHMQKCVGLLKSKTGILARANEMAKELARLSDTPSSYADSQLPAQMEAMFADPEFEDQAQVFAKDMQNSVKEWDLGATGNTESQSESEGLNAALSAEKFYEVMSDPTFQQYQESIANKLESIKGDSDLQRQALSIAEHVESAQWAAQGTSEAAVTQVSQQIDAMMRKSKLREMGSTVVHEMLRTEAEPTAREWVDGLDSAQLTHISRHPVLFESIIQDLQMSAQESQASLAESDLTTGQDAAPAPIMPPLNSALAGFSFPSQLGLPPQLHPMQTTAERPSVAASPPIVNPWPWPRDPWEENSASMSEAQARLLEAGSGADLSDISQDQQTLLELQKDQRGSALTSSEGLRSMMPSLVKALPHRSKDAVMSADGKTTDFSLLLCLGVWYLGTYLYSITNKVALTHAGGSAGFPFTIATLQFGVGAVYALFMWLAPDARSLPDISFKDYVATLPLSFAAAGAQAASVFAMSAGSLSFFQIVKASEPAFAAIVATTIYSQKVSKAKWLTLIPVIGGVVLASLGEVNFALSALVTACLANMFVALLINESGNLMNAPGLSKRIGHVGNQFSLMTINSFFIMLPLMLLTEGHRIEEFMTLIRTDSALQHNLFLSGLWSQVYKETAERVIQKTSAVTRSVANVAGRVIVLVAVAVVMKESLSPLKMIGSGMSIGGVYLYSTIDKLVAARKAKQLQSSESTSYAMRDGLTFV